MESRAIFEEAEGQRFLNALSSTIAKVGIFLIFIFSITDYLLAPEHFGLFLWLRLGVAATVILCAFVAKTFRYPKHAWVLGFIVTLTAASMVAIEAHYTGGEDSAFFFGINIVATALVAFAQVPPRRCALNLIAIYSLYIPVVLLTPPPINWSFALYQALYCLSFATLAYVSNRLIWELRYIEFLSRKRMESDQMTKEVQLRKLNDVVDIARQAAHDIRSPLTALDAVAKNMSNISLDQKKLFTAVADRFIGISEHLLKTSKAISAPSESGPQSSLSAQEAFELLGNLAEEKRLAGTTKQLMTEFSPPIADRPLVGNRVELGAIVSNLVNNAIEATRERGTIRLISRFEEQGMEVFIEDDGDGIPKHLQEELFTRPVTFGKENGNGLGLFSANRIITKWGGQFSLKSEPGAGTSIRLLVPFEPSL